jgi:hypothetical protein
LKPAVCTGFATEDRRAVVPIRREVAISSCGRGFHKWEGRKGGMRRWEEEGGSSGHQEKKNEGGKETTKFSGRGALFFPPFCP